MNLSVIIVGVVAFVVSSIAWYLYEQRSSVTTVPDPLKRKLDAVDALVRRKLAGEVLTEPEYQRAGDTFAELYGLLSRAHRSEHNTDFSLPDRGTFFFFATKLAALDHPDHTAWPALASIRYSVLPALKSRLETDGDDWTRLALIMPAICEGELDLAARTYAELEHRPDYQSLAVRWARQAVFVHPEENDVEAVEDFMDRADIPHEPEPFAEGLDEVQRWVLATGVFPSWIRDSRQALPAADPIASTRIALETWWNIEDYASATTKIEWLFEGGHRASLRELLDAPELDPKAPFEAFVATHRAALEVYGIVAWDLCRLNQVARSAVRARFVDEATAWTWMLRAARALRATYPSWEAMGEDYLLGAAFFAAEDGGEPEPSHAANVAWLKTSAWSPWRTLDWSIDAARLEKGTT